MSTCEYIRAVCSLSGDVDKYLHNQAFIIKFFTLFPPETSGSYEVGFWVKQWLQYNEYAFPRDPVEICTGKQLHNEDIEWIEDRLNQTLNFVPEKKIGRLFAGDVMMARGMAMRERQCREIIERQEKVVVLRTKKELRPAFDEALAEARAKLKNHYETIVRVGIIQTRARFVDNMRRRHGDEAARAAAECIMDG